MFSGTDGVYTYGASYQKDPDCIICSAGLVIRLTLFATLDDLIKEVKHRFPAKVSSSGKVDGDGMMMMEGEDKSDRDHTDSNHFEINRWTSPKSSEGSSKLKASEISISSRLLNPSIAWKSNFLRAHGMWEQETRSNLSRLLLDLIPEAFGCFRRESNGFKGCFAFKNRGFSENSCIVEKGKGQQVLGPATLMLNDKSLPTPIRLQIYLDPDL
mmetsp:Transcript_31165/g.56587  ORF Transcript_31165/g.56587 Transcript_31165/m.56587 type:complete len:213 (-) Transcript_31165:218-856(-)